MYGVVLWSDLAQNKAVFWCEDHGDLAFYHADPETSPTIELDAGDLVQFDLAQEAKLRKALNPRVVREGALVDLPERLQAEGNPRSAATDAQIVQFPARARTENQIMRLMVSR